MKAKEIMELASDLEYLKEELEVNNRLWSDRIDGYVTLDKLIEYCKENDHILEMVIKIAKKVNQ
ncbi:hypothetical protein NVP1172O_33 [Vibrio phage 1.172.O._10N.261.52.F5]|nr:hypothetical protein NVP1116O_33 [Vibrio phage 1.116.O._10N.222.52.C10]AUR92448.1 hypothetical protein NVP1172O_33 [Vibrio phage 1.172.O._10N.261.52.F5]